MGRLAFSSPFSCVEESELISIELISIESLNGCVFWASCALLAKLVLLGSGGGVTTGTNELVCVSVNALALSTDWLKL